MTGGEFLARFIVTVVFILVMAKVSQSSPISAIRRVAGVSSALATASLSWLSVSYLW